MTLSRLREDASLEGRGVDGRLTPDVIRIQERLNSTVSFYTSRLGQVVGVSRDGRMTRVDMPQEPKPNPIAE